MDLTINKEMFDKYELYRSLKRDFEKSYHYEFCVESYNEPAKWCESTDTLSNIMFKAKEFWSIPPKIIEEVK